MKKMPVVNVIYYDSNWGILQQYSNIPVLFTDKFKRYTTYGHPAVAVLGDTGARIDGLTSNGTHYSSLSNIAAITINPATAFTFTPKYNLKNGTIAPGPFGGPAAIYKTNSLYQADPYWNGSVSNSEATQRAHIYANAIFSGRGTTVSSTRTFKLILMSTVYDPGYIYICSCTASSTMLGCNCYKISEIADTFRTSYERTSPFTINYDKYVTFSLPSGYAVAPPHFGGLSRTDAVLVYNTSTLKMAWFYPFQSSSASSGTNTVTTAISNITNNNASPRIGPASYLNDNSLSVVSETGNTLKTLVSSGGLASDFLSGNTCWIGQNHFLPIGDDFYMLAGYYYPQAVMGIKYYVSGSTWYPDLNSTVRPATDFNPDMFTIGYYSSSDYVAGATLDITEELIPPSGTYRTSTNISWVAQ